MILPEKITPQSSERWVVYTLVCPLMVEVSKRFGWDYHFEYSQPVGPNRSRKVDVALLRGEQPVWYVEAKKWEKYPAPGMVTSYLHDNVAGVVTNGNYWVFVVTRLEQQA